MNFKETSGLANHAKENRRGGRSGFEYSPPTPKLKQNCGYCVIGTRTTNGQAETFRTPLDGKWYRFAFEETMLAAMKKNHPSWDWKIEYERPN